MQYVDVVVGGQYGSEAKGHVTAQLVKQAVTDIRENELDVDVINVRVAGPNAGHTVYDEDGQKFAFRQLPVGAVVDKNVKLYIAPGSEIDPQVLYNEIMEAQRHGWPIAGRLYISKQATVITQENKDYEGSLVGKIGSTGKGIGAARAARLMREGKTFAEWYGDIDADTPWAWAEPEDLYADDDLVHDGNQHVIIEGTQGYALSLRASGHYPYTTSSDCRSIDFLAMAGLDPTRCSVRVTNWIVARVFPIRVAGNSGPMEGETSWDELGLPEERTTVTQKVRRVGRWDVDLLRRAVQANGGHSAKVIITMLDQVIPELADLDVDGNDEALGGSEALHKAMDWIEDHASYEQIGAHVAGITFGPTKILWNGHAQPGGQPEPEQIKEALGGIDIQAIIAQAINGEKAGN